MALLPIRTHKMTIRVVGIELSALSTMQSVAKSFAVMHMMLAALHLAQDIRQCLRVANDDESEDSEVWCATSEIYSRVEDFLIGSESRSGERHPSMIRSCLVSEARILGEALYGDDSNLWSLLLVLVCHARMGSKFCAVSGAIGSGKTQTIVATTTVLSLVSVVRVAMIMDANDPMDDTMDLAWRVLSESTQLVRVTGHNHVTDLEQKAPRCWAAAIVSSNARVKLHDTKSTLLCCTLDLCIKRLGGFPLIPSEAFASELVYFPTFLYSGCVRRRSSSQGNLFFSAFFCSGHLLSFFVCFLPFNAWRCE